MLLNRISAPLLAAALIGAGAAHAQGAEQAIQFDGQMHAMAKECAGYTPDQLAELRETYRAKAIDAGVSEANFNTHFKAGQEKALAKYSAATPAEQEAGCKQARMLAGF